MSFSGFSCFLGFSYISRVSCIFLSFPYISWVSCVSWVSHVFSGSLLCFPVFLVCFPCISWPLVCFLGFSYIHGFLYVYTCRKSSERNARPNNGKYQRGEWLKARQYCQIIRYLHNFCTISHDSTCHSIFPAKVWKLNPEEM